MQPALKEQKTIPSSPEVRVVEASAGSGKTYTLAKRYIQLLFDPSLEKEQIPIRNILAVTFTNKAAFEMKERILQFLKAIALGNLKDSDYEEILKPIGVDYQVAQKKAFSIMEALIRHYNFFQVQTIDKFINALLSGCAFRIGLTANFKIKTNSAEYLELGLDELIDRAHQNKSTFKIFEGFLHNYLYLDNRTGWFPRKEILRVVKNLYDQFNRYGLAFREGPHDNESIIKKKREILKDLKSIQEKLPEGTDKRFQGSLERFLIEHPQSFDIDSTSRYFSREEFPARKDTKVPKDVERLWAKQRNNFKELCEQEAVSLFNPYVGIFNEVKEDFLKLAAKDDVLFLEELNKRATALFDEDHITVVELYYRLAARFRHYLIDEFQDTSRLQWKNLEEMVKEALATQGTLFYVGDPKQAIYGFRGGDVKLFYDVKQQFEPFHVKSEFLTKNWRSQKAIVAFNNKIFSQDNLKRMIHEWQIKEDDAKKVFDQAGIEEIAAVFAEAQQSHRDELTDGYVKVEYCDMGTKEEFESALREKLAVLIDNLRERFSFRDIAILTRNNQQVEDLTSWLVERNLPVESERTLNIKENHLVQELITLLKFLASPIDNISFAQFILGDIFTKAAGLSKEELQQFVFERKGFLREKKDFYLYMEFRKEYKDLWERYFEEFFKNVGLYPLYELIVSIYHRYGLLSLFAEAQGFFMHFLEIVRKSEEEYADINSFLEHFEELEGEELYIKMPDTDAIKILTIHKSKGLEYPVCIIPFLGMDVQVGAQSTENQQAYILKENEGSMELIRFKDKYFDFSDELLEIYRQEYKKGFINELNNIYVALTRAQNELYAFIPKKIGSSSNLAKFLIPQDSYENGQQVKYSPQAKKDRSVMKLSSGQHQDWIAYLKEEFMEATELEHRDVRCQGEVIHLMLSCIGNLSTEDKNKSINNALIQVKRQFPFIKEPEKNTKLIEKILKDKKLASFFYCEKANVLTEKDVVTKNGETKRLDRLIVKDNEVWIVDYKSSRDTQGRYDDQVKEYKTIMQKLYPKHKVKGYLLYLDTIDAEEVT